MKVKISNLKTINVIDRKYERTRFVQISSARNERL